MYIDSYFLSLDTIKSENFRFLVQESHMLADRRGWTPIMHYCNNYRSRLNYLLKYYPEFFNFGDFSKWNGDMKMKLLIYGARYVDLNIRGY